VIPDPRLPPSCRAVHLIHALEANDWVDQFTRAVLIEFNLLNPNSGLFNQVNSGLFNQVNSGLFNQVNSGLFNQVNSGLFNQVIIAFEYTNDGSTLWKFLDGPYFAPQPQKITSF